MSLPEEETPDLSEVRLAEPPVAAGDAKLGNTEKLAVELGPLALLLLGYFKADALAPMLDRLLGTAFFAEDGNSLYVGLALFLPAFAAAFIWSFVRVRRVAPILLVTAVLTVGLGAMTFILQDKTFFYMKPTLVYGGIAAALATGLVLKKNFLKLIFDGALEMDEGPWRTLTWRFVAFNAAGAVANEILWRSLTADCVADAECPGEAVWLNVKLFGFMGAYLIFMAANGPFLMRHLKES